MFNKKKDNYENERSYKTKKYLVEYAQRTLDLENEREKNIIKNSKTMITCNSILLVPLLTIIFELYNRIEKARIIIITFGIILSFLIIFGILFAIFAQQLYKSSYTKSAKELLDYINFNSIDDEEYPLDQTISDLDAIYKSKCKNNELRKKFLFVSYILNYTFNFLLIVSLIIILIII